VIFAVQGTLAFLLAPVLAAIVAFLIVLGAIGVWPMLARSRSLGEFVADANLSLLDTTTQFMGGLKLAISQDLQTAFVSQVDRTLQNLAGRQTRFARQQAFGQSALIALFGVMGLAAVCAGLFWFQSAPSLLIAFLLVMARMTAPVEQIHQAAQQFTHLLVVYNNMQSFQRELVLATRKDRIGTEARCPDPEGDIAFENVTYRHDALESASKQHMPERGIRDLRLTIRRGEFLAVTGDSGVGKTTFADLLAGLYTPQSGHITVGNELLDRTGTAAWRARLAYVPQDPFLFHDTIRRNLSWANPNAGDSEIWQSLATAGADQLVRQMEHGLDSVVGERGSLLSGGERQRVALARALLRNPRLLILDEATNALDSESEKAILARLRAMGPRPTIVLIAQRTENLDACDRVIRFDMLEGRTVASAAD
jgi:ATP-binding cassette subfamily C protein